MTESDTSAESPLRIGVSTCLLGENVRFDGGHKRDAYLLGTLAQFVEWVPVCPEVGVGMGTPRESVRLVGDGDNILMLGVRSKTDWTERMNRYVTEKATELTKADLDGFILKSKSPTCGMERVKVYTPGGMPNKGGRGLFAEALITAMPLLPVEEEGRLNDPILRESFIVRVFCHRRWKAFRSRRFSLKRLTEFHAQHKFLLMAHSEKHMRSLGQLVAGAKGKHTAEILNAYEHGFFEALMKRPTRRRHRNVLDHIAGFFKKELSTDDRQELHQAIDDYTTGLAPMIVPLTLIRHHARNRDIDYIRDQLYLSPHPKELMLLNHV